MTKAKPILFISHSSKDYEKVKVIFKVLRKYGLSNKSHTIIFTSHSVGSLNAGQNIANETVVKVDEAEIFIAYISENFKSTPICMAELGVAFAKKERKGMRSFKYLLIKDRYTDFDKTTELGLGNIMMDANNPVTIENEFNKAFAKTVVIKDELKKGFDKIYDGFDYKLEEAITDVRVFINKTFDCNHLLCDNPVTLHVDRKLYEELSVKLTKISDQRLLWTAYKSPLNIDKIFLDSKGLTKYDIEFSKAYSNKRQRLIIFDTTAEQKKFFGNSLTGQDKTRKKGFVDSNKGILYHTTVNEILDSFNDGKTRNQQIKLAKKDELYFEFALIESKNINILVFSDFDNKNTFTSGSIIQPLIFIRANSPVDHIFQKKIENSIKVNKYISGSFDDLIIKQVIKKV